MLIRVPTRWSTVTALPLASLLSVRSVATIPAGWSPGEASAGTASVKGTIWLLRPGTVSSVTAVRSQLPASVEAVPSGSTS